MNHYTCGVVCRIEHHQGSDAVINNASTQYGIGVQNYPPWSPNFVQVGLIFKVDAMKLSQPVQQCLKRPIVCAFSSPSL